MLGDLRIHHHQDFAGAAMMYQLAVNTATRREFGSNLYLIGKVGANTGRLCACTSLWLMLCATQTQGMDMIHMSEPEAELVALQAFYASRTFASNDYLRAYAAINAGASAVSVHFCLLSPVPG